MVEKNELTPEEQELIRETSEKIVKEVIKPSVDNISKYFNKLYKENKKLFDTLCKDDIEAFKKLKPICINNMVNFLICYNGMLMNENWNISKVDNYYLLQWQVYNFNTKKVEKYGFVYDCKTYELVQVILGKEMVFTEEELNDFKNENLNSISLLEFKKRNLLMAIENVDNKIKQKVKA
jgi:hypothetical protein